MSEAINRYHTAKGYFQASIMIARSPERNTHSREMMTALPINMLIGFSLELYFKAWMLASGHQSKDVRAYGHKLSKIYSDAKDSGLPEIDLLGDLVAVMSRGHEDYTFRYMDDDDVIANVLWGNAFVVIDRLDTIVDEKVGASASYGLAPGH